MYSISAIIKFDRNMECKWEYIYIQIDNFLYHELMRQNTTTTQSWSFEAVTIVWD